MSTLARRLGAFSALCLCLGSAAAQSQQAVTTGELVVEPATLISDRKSVV